MTQVSCHQWGEVPGQGSVDIWNLKTPLVEVEILTLGATIKSLKSRGKGGQIADVVLGYDDLEGKTMSQQFLGPEKNMYISLSVHVL